jgi:hypothetical protein
MRGSIPVGGVSDAKRVAMRPAYNRATPLTRFCAAVGTETTSDRVSAPTAVPMYRKDMLALR